MDSPGTVTSRTTDESASGGATVHPVAPPRDDPFANWTPSEVTQKLVNSNVRWGLMAGILMIALGLTGLGYWIYQQPSLAVEAAHDDLLDSAQILQPSIEAVLAVDTAAAGSDVSEQLVLINADARSLFNVAGALPKTLSNERSIAADIAGQALEGSRILNDAYAYRSAVLPILVVPDFETDPALITLDDAAATFGLWQTHFQDVIAALPAGMMNELEGELTLISANLEVLQTRYLDALRTDNPGGVAIVVHELNTSLADAEMLFHVEFDEMSTIAQAQFIKALESINLLFG